MHLAQFLMSRVPLLRRLTIWATKHRTIDMANRICRDLPKNSLRICDIGCGPGQIARELQRRGLTVTGVDRVDFQFFNDFQAVVYQGDLLPFADNSFDVALLITVLHHCTDPLKVLAEALRIAPRVLVIEDVVRGPLHTVATKALDSVFNGEFIGHPHSNKTDEEWFAAFAEIGAVATKTYATWDFLVMWQVSYLLERKPTAARLNQPLPGS